MTYRCYVDAVDPTNRALRVVEDTPLFDHVGATGATPEGAVEALRSRLAGNLILCERWLMENELARFLALVDADVTALAQQVVDRDFDAAVAAINRIHDAVLRAQRLAEQLKAAP